MIDGSGEALRYIRVQDGKLMKNAIRGERSEGYETAVLEGAAGDFDSKNRVNHPLLICLLDRPHPLSAGCLGKILCTRIGLLIEMRLVVKTRQNWNQNRI